MVFAGTNDARGFNQWKEVNRSVKKGAKALYILGPSFKKHSADDENAAVAVPQAQSPQPQALKLIGFHAIPVFRYEDTEGEPLSQPPDTQAYIDGLPLNEVAHEWGLNVIATAAEGYLGYYSSHASTIALAVKNLSTWAHELTHAADDRIAPLKGGQHADQEIVAELGGATILQMLGYDVEADLGGAWDYIKSYAKDADHAISLAMGLIDRTAKAIDLILTTSEQFTPVSIVA